jgi:hypothetical protein
MDDVPELLHAMLLERVLAQDSICHCRGWHCRLTISLDPR